jgi:uncharacterized phage-associated protein
LRAFRPIGRIESRVEKKDLAGNREYDPARFENLVLLVAWEMRDDPGFGRTKLAKTLFYVDFDAYVEGGESITGATYEHWQHGPFPPQLYDAERALVDQGRASVSHPEYPGDEAKLVPTADPHLGQSFDDWVRVLVARRAHALAQDPSWQVEDAPHRHPGWELTSDREEIPYNTHFISRDTVRPPEIAFELGRRIAREHYEWS